MDNLSKSQRSRIMSLVKSKNTKPELTIRHSLFKLGFRYRLYKKLPGTPDLTFPKYKCVVFIHGCFWHNHQGCNLNRLPKDHQDYWLKKKINNQTHDIEAQKQLLDKGWRILIVWECACARKLIDKVCQKIEKFLKDQSVDFGEISGSKGMISDVFLSRSKINEIRDNAK